AGFWVGMPRIIMNRAFIARWTRMPHSTGRLSASASSHHGLSSAAFITNIAESDFRHAQPVHSIHRTGSERKCRLALESIADCYGKKASALMLDRARFKFDSAPLWSARRRCSDRTIAPRHEIGRASCRESGSVTDCERVLIK